MRTTLALLALTVTAAAQTPFSSPALDDLGAGTFGVGEARTGWLYEHGGVGSNCLPASHVGAVQGAADAIAPVADAVVLLSLGGSLTGQIFATFERQVDAAVMSGQPLAQHHPQLVLVNGAQGGEASKIPVASSTFWGRVDDRLASLGLTHDQVKIVWLSSSHKCAPGSAEWECADLFHAELRQTLQFLKAQKFPGLELCYLSSRIYAGHTPPVMGQTGEPKAYQESWGVRGVIREQTECTPGAGLCLGQDVVPVVLWGPYLWASGTTARTGEPGCLSSAIGAGLTWKLSDFEADGLHPNGIGERKAAARMHAFFRADPYVGKWFAPDCSAGRLLTVEASADAYVDETAPTSNFGAASELVFERSAANEKIVLVQFDLSGLHLSPGDVRLAKLSFRNPDWVSASRNQFPDLALVETEDGWSEGAVTWNNQPATLGGPVAWMAGADRDSSRAASVTAMVQDALAPAGDGVLSLAFRVGSVADSRSLSRETGEGPRLILSVTSPEVTETYCTAGTSASGCRATISATGTASACSPSAFTVRADGVEGGKNGLLFLGTGGRKAAPWGNCSSYRCVEPPLQRTPHQVGGGTPGACDNSFDFEFNSWACQTSGSVPTPGLVVQIQAWYRDPANTCNQTTSFSDALEFYVCP
jgi:hypothetical protein